MAPETRPSSLSLMQALLERPHTFSFFQMICLLQRYTGGARLGREGPASEEMLRLRPAVSMRFPTADIETLELEPQRDSGPRRFQLTTAFMGLNSSDSPLPTYYTEDILWSETDQQTVREFLDIFHHRALSLLYRTWEKYRYDMQFQAEGADEYSRRVFCLIGLGSAELVDAVGLPAVRLLRYAGLITQKPHSATALAAVLKDYFTLPRVEVEQCRERWVRIDPQQQNSLGAKNCALGRDLNIGHEVRDRNGKFRIELGPLKLEAFVRFLPVSADYAALVNITRFLVTDRLDFDIQVKLQAAEVPTLQLSSSAPLRLGWTSWLQPAPGQDQSIVVRQPHQQLPQIIFPWPGATHAGADASTKGNSLLSRTA